MVNKVCGYGAVAPWQVGQFSEELAEFFADVYQYETEQAEKARQQAEGKRQFENVLSKRRAQHPSYRKY